MRFCSYWLMNSLKTVRFLMRSSTCVRIFLSRCADKKIVLHWRFFFLCNDLPASQISITMPQMCWYYQRFVDKSSRSRNFLFRYNRSCSNLPENDMNSRNISVVMPFCVQGDCRPTNGLEYRIPLIIASSSFMRSSSQLIKRNRLL
jgi:hypothetical protein